MKKFSFTLQPVLQQREKQEEECQRVLGDRMRALEEYRAYRVSLDVDQARCQERLLAPVGASVNASEHKLTHVWLKEITFSIELCDQKIIEAERAMESARDALIEATRQKQVVAKLREKQAEEHQRAIQTEEQKILDEVAVTKYGREEAES